MGLGKSAKRGIEIFFENVFGDIVVKPAVFPALRKFFSDLAGGSRVVSIDKMGSVSFLKVGLLGSADDDEFDIESQCFYIFPTGETFPLIKPNDEKQAGGFREGFPEMPNCFPGERGRRLF